MSLTEILAIVGAATGVTGSILGIMSYRRDRAKVVVRGEGNWGRGPARHDYYLHIYLHNAGRRPVALRHVGVLTSHRRGITILLRRAPYGSKRASLLTRLARLKTVATVHDSLGESLLLPPGPSKEYVLKATGFTSVRMSQTYVYAIDVANRIAATRVPLEGTAESWADPDLPAYDDEDYDDED